MEQKSKRMEMLEVIEELRGVVHTYADTNLVDHVNTLFGSKIKVELLPSTYRYLSSDGNGTLGSLVVLELCKHLNVVIDESHTLSWSVFHSCDSLTNWVNKNIN